MEDIISIKYLLGNTRRIKLFGKKFVENNKGLCRLKINEKEIELCEFYELEKRENVKKIDKLKAWKEMEIILIGFNNITNMSNMFSGCKFLSPETLCSNWNTSQITDMSYLFEGCVTLRFLPDISYWDTSNVKNMKYMFSNCTALQMLHNISRWNTSNVTDISYMFNECKNLENLPDISIWELGNVENISGIFN